MTNEELAQQIQAGQTELIEELWLQVEPIIRRRAKDRVSIVGNFGGCEVDDYVQSGYFAILAAVKDYNPETGYKFSTFLGYRLRSAFAEAAGIRSQKRDALLYAVSLDAPIDEEAETPETLLDTLAAPGNDYEAAEDRVFNEQLHEALEKALAALKPAQGDLIRRRYYDGATLKEIAAESNVSIQNVQAKERDAFIRLYQIRSRFNLEQFIDSRTPFYRHRGVQAFQATGITEVESIVFEREHIRKTLERRELSAEEETAALR